MNACELTASITAIANWLACQLSQDKLELLGVSLTQLGDTLLTIATQKSICCKWIAKARTLIRKCVLILALLIGHYLSAIWIGEFSSTCLLCSPEMAMFWNRIPLEPQCFSRFESWPFTSAYFWGSFGTFFHTKNGVYSPSKLIFRLYPIMIESTQGINGSAL